MKEHYFIAIAMPVEMKQELLLLSNIVKKYGACKSFVHPIDYHLTLSFIGSLGFSQVQALKKELSKIAYKYKEIPVQIKGINIFGTTTSPRIIWADVLVYNKLLLLQEEICNICDSLNITYDKKLFKPHVTIARRWQETYDFPLEKIQEDFYKTERKSFYMQHIVLYKTHKERNPKYQPIGIYSLQV